MSKLCWKICKATKLRSSWVGCVKPEQVAHRLYLRFGGSDIDVFSQIFIEEEYLPLRTLENVNWIVDIGANVGYSAAYFLNCFPEASVLAIEPDDDNFAICKRNLAPYGSRAKVLHGAAWSHCTSLELSRGAFRDGREWAVQVRETGNHTGPVAAWDIGSIISKVGHSTIDLLKIDIEGAELEIFKEDARLWLAHVRNLCIELHGEEHEAAFIERMKPFSYEFSRSGELVICRNITAKRC